jgi:hypothetical protein
MAEKTLRQKLLDRGWLSSEVDTTVSVVFNHLPSEAPSNPLNSSAYDYGFQLGYNAYRAEVLRNLQ